MSGRLVTVALAVSCLLPTPAALASPGDGSGQGSGGQEADVILAQVSYSTSGGSTSSGGCSWELKDGVTIGVPELGSVTWPRVVDGVTHHLWMRTCNGAVAYVDVPEVQPTDILPQLLDQLRERTLPKPVPVFEMLDPEFGWAYVQTPLDFRAGGDSWRPVSVTASVGPIWATVTARPTSLAFDPGDPANPGSVTCSGSGPVAGYDPAAPGACSYTYVNSSSTSQVDGYHFATSLSITWAITWTSSTGAGGALDSYTTTTTSLLAVAEVKGLVECTGPRPEQGGC